MKAFNNTFLLLAAAMLTAGTASAQTNANPKPAVQGRVGGLPAVRGVFGNFQIAATTRANALDNISYVSQVGLSNFSSVDQRGTKNVADMVQVNSSLIVRGNDGYQSQRGSANDAYMLQVGNGNYACQDQNGDRNVALSMQGNNNSPRSENYSVQEQAGSANYGHIEQNSNNNFAHQNQTSNSLTTSLGGGLSPSSILNGNYADTRQGNGSAGSNNQWSQVVQNGQNNRSIVRQDTNGSGGGGGGSGGGNDR